MESSACQRRCEKYNEEKQRVVRDRHVHTVDQAEVELAMLLPRFLHGGHFRWNEALDDAVSVPNLIMRPIASSDQAELLADRGKRGFDLLHRVLFQTVQDDITHFLAQAGEASEFVEDAVIP